MGKLIRIFAVGAVLFGISGGASWYLLGSKAADAEAAVGGGEIPLPVPDGELPVSVRPRAMTPEELVIVSSQLQAREQALNERAASMERQQAQLKLALVDVQGEQLELESLHAKAQSALETLSGLLQELKDERQQFEQDQSAAADDLKSVQLARLELKADEQKNMKELAETMKAETAASTIRNFVNDGEIELAVELLSHFEERDAAQILETLAEDEELMGELVRKYIQRARPETTKKKR